MHAHPLSTVAKDLVETTGNTAHNVVHAYRAGGEYLVGQLEQRWHRALAQSRPQLSAETADNATAAQQAFSSYYTKGLNLSTQGVQSVVNQLVRLASSGVQRVAANADRFEEKTGLRALNTLAQASLPGATVLCTLAHQVEAQSAKLVRTVAGGQRASTKRKKS